MLTRLAIKNFKSIGDPGLDLELKPLTLLVGPNGAGKSSVLEALAFFVQNATSSYMSGPYLFFETVDDLQHKQDSQVMEPIDIILEGGKLAFQLRCYRTNVQGVDQTAFTSSAAQRNPIVRLLTSPESVFLPVASQRGEIARHFNAGNLTNWIGLRGEHLPIVEQKLSEVPQKYREAERWGQKFGLSDPRSEWLGGNSLGSHFKDSALRADLPKAFASYGGRQAWAIVIQIIACSPEQIITIEEPEISLHPQAQVDMAELLATAAKEGKQILATTHSTFLLLGVGKAIRAGIISPDQVAIYEVTKGPEGSTAKALPVDKKGNIQDWEDSWFGKVELALLSNWSKGLSEV